MLWAETYTHDSIKKAIGITRGWMNRSPYGKDATIPESEVYRYTTGVLRHLAKAYDKADALLGVEL